MYDDIFYSIRCFNRGNADDPVDMVLYFARVVPAMGQIRICWEVVALSPLMPRRKIDESDETVSDLPFISTYARNGGYGSKGGGKQLPELSW